MNKLQALFSALCIALLMSSCAGSYRAIHPASLPYVPSQENNDVVQLGYRYNVLAEKNNKKLVKAEKKRKIRLVAVEITNTSDKPLTFGQDILLYADGRPVTMLSKASVYGKLKQKPGFFFFYLSFMQFNLNVETLQPNGQVKTSFYPIGLLLGPALALPNFFKGKANNKKFLAELNLYDLMGKEIQAGQTVHGLIGIRQASFAPLQIQLKKPKNLEVNDEYYIEQFN